MTIRSEFNSDTCCLLRETIDVKDSIDSSDWKVGDAAGSLT